MAVVWKIPHSTIRSLFMKTKLTADSVNGAATTGKQYYITDTDVSRFALRVSATGKTKMFTYRADLPKTDEHPKRRLKDIDLGRSDEVSVREARKRAIEIRAKLQSGWDPDAPEIVPNQRPEPQEGDIHYDIACTLIIKDKAAMQYGLNSHYEKPEVYKTYPQYLRDVIRSTHRFYKFAKLENVPLKNITYKDVYFFHRSRTADAGAPAANRDCQHLRSIFNRAVELEWIPFNPALNIKYNKEIPKKKPIPQKELQNFLERLETHRNFMAKKAVLFALMTGLRQKNILDLAWQDNLVNNYVDMDKNEFVLREHKTSNRTNKEIIIPFNDEAREFLLTLPRKKDNNHVFHSRGKSHINKRVYTQAFKHAKAAIDERYELKNVTANSTRHTFATNLINNSDDINLEDVADLLGHTSTAMVRKTYGQMLTNYRNKLRKKIVTLESVSTPKVVVES